ncbi:G/U mismatch-specific DNA glycosylase [Candidatus Roizmanbacteria bacterium]|nr:G/U mismatch-specific DNA glycosylase [Candidatus Roizmanbacteria bacterium]
MSLPTKKELEACANKTVEDVIKSDLTILFVGINPGLYTAYTGFHYARPGNRFWPTLYGAGFTDRLLKPSESSEMLRLGYGLTNVVSRASTSASEISKEGYQAGGKILIEKIEKYHPKWVAFVGIQAYRAAFSKPKATIGMQNELLGGAHVWLLPSPSGLNAHYKPSDFVRIFQEFRLAVEE